MPMNDRIRFPVAAIAALERGQRIEAIRLVREGNDGLDLRGAMEAVDAYAAGERDFSIADSTPSASTAVDDQLPAEAIAALSRGQVIAAIKIVRQACGSGLKEAKDRVDAYRANPGSQDMQWPRVIGRDRARARVRGGPTLHHRSEYPL